MKKTVLFAQHENAGAKMVEFAGYAMPVSYEGVKAEHLYVRSKAGVFDVSHMGEFLISGKTAVDLVQYVTSNNVKKLKPGEAQYSCMPMPNGGIVDDLLVYCLNEQLYLLVVNASNIQKDFDWLQQHNRFEARVENVSDAWSLLAVQGPESETILQSLTEVDLSAIQFYTFVSGTVGGANEVIISATGYTGERGFELYLKNEWAPPLWDALLEKGVHPCGLAARDTLRLEMGYALYGNDIDENTSSLEANLGWITRLKTKDDFVGKAYLKEQKAKGIQRKLVGFKMIERGIPRKDYALLNTKGETIGKVTSGTQSPSLNEGIGMGYINDFSLQHGDAFFVEIRGKSVEAQLCGLPFYKPR